MARATKRNREIKKARKVKHTRISRKIKHTNKIKHTKKVRNSKRKTNTRKKRGGMDIKNPFGLFKGRRERTSIAAPPILEEEEEEEFEIVDLEDEARRRASEIYEDYKSREYITGPYGSVLREIRDKQQKACEEAKKSIIDDPQFGRSIWVMIENEFPCPLGLMPEEEAEKLGTIISPKSWNEIIKIGKENSRFREIFVKTFFTDLTHYHVKPKFIRNEYTNDEVRTIILDGLLPFEKKYLDKNPKALNAIVRIIQTLSSTLKDRINVAVLNYAKKYWSEHGQNYMTTKDHILERFGETVWSNIKDGFKEYLQQIRRREDSDLRTVEDWHTGDDSPIAVESPESEV
jgi:hypothetical protein